MVAGVKMEIHRLDGSVITDGNIVAIGATDVAATNQIGGLGAFTTVQDTAARDALTPAIGDRVKILYPQNW